MHEPLSRIATVGLTFQQPYSELEIAVELVRESVAVAAISKALISAHCYESSMQQVHFTGEVRFVNAMMHRMKGQQNRKRTIFNCESNLHLVK